MPDDETDPPQTMPFAAILNALDRGRTAVELGRRLQELVTKVRETGKAGKLTFTLTVKRSRVDGMINITEIVKEEKPEFDRHESSFFFDDDGNLTQTDPRQTELDYGPRALDRKAN